MRINEIISFLETDKLSVTFSDKGLKYLSLGDNGDKDIVRLSVIDKIDLLDPMVGRLIQETNNFLETGSHKMPLDLGDHTPFQQMVFHAVNKVGVGNICTYKELAMEIGRPNAARAVGSALAKNPVAYFIPTHRILPQRGIGTCRSGAGYLREKLLIHEGHDIEKLR